MIKLVLSMVGMNVARSGYDKILWHRSYWNRSLIFIEDFKRSSLKI